MRKRFKRNKSGVEFIFIFILISMISLGYATLSSKLEVDGTAKILKTTWDVHYENIKVTVGSVNAALPEILDDTKIKYSVEMSSPGDFYEFEFDVVNDGTIDAVINEVTETDLTDAQKKYLTYSLSYKDGSKISVGDELLKKQTKTLKVRLEYKTDVNSEDLPDKDEEIKMTLHTEYIQKGTTSADSPDNPEIDDSKYWDCGDAKMDGYVCLKLTWTPERFWDSTKAATSGPDKSDSIGNRYWSTQIIEKNDIPNGTIIIIAKGWSYRPEGWQSLNAKNANSRPAGTAVTTTTVDDTWRSDYNYRAFNVYNISIGDISGYTEDQINEVFHIYVPIS